MKLNPVLKETATKHGDVYFDDETGHFMCVVYGKHVRYTSEKDLTNYVPKFSIVEHGVCPNCGCRDEGNYKCSKCRTVLRW